MRAFGVLTWSPPAFSIFAIGFVWLGLEGGGGPLEFQIVTLPPLRRPLRHAQG